MGRAYVTELNGLRVPAEYDCDIFNKKGGSWGNHKYFFEVPSRWTAWEHHAMLQSGITLFQPKLPIVDDEYNEHVAAYPSVLHAHAAQPYAVLELSALCWRT